MFAQKTINEGNENGSPFGLPSTRDTKWRCVMDAVFHESSTMNEWLLAELPHQTFNRLTCNVFHSKRLHFWMSPDTILGCNEVKQRSMEDISILAIAWMVTPVTLLRMTNKQHACMFDARSKMFRIFYWILYVDFSDYTQAYFFGVLKFTHVQRNWNTSPRCCLQRSFSN